MYFENETPAWIAHTQEGVGVITDLKLSLHTRTSTHPPQKSNQTKIPLKIPNPCVQHTVMKWLQGPLQSVDTEMGR